MPTTTPPDHAPSSRHRVLAQGVQAAGVASIAALLVGLAALFFAQMEGATGHWITWARVHAPWVFWVTLPGGLMLVLYLRDKYFIGTQGTGIPQVIAALQMPDPGQRSRVLSLRIAAGKLLLTTIGLLAALSIGREGPSVQVGACLMHEATRWAKFPAHLVRRGLVLGGGGAGIAAAFNAPFAGMVFAFEEIGRSFEKENASMLVRTILLASLVCVIGLGNYYFYGDLAETNPAALQFDGVMPWLAIPLVAIIGGALGGCFSRLLLLFMPVVTGWIKRRALVVGAVFGLAAAGLMVLSSGTTLGGGYTQAKAILSPELYAADYAEIGVIYPLYRALASFLVLLTAIPGGLFDPTLSVGAGLGHSLAPLLTWTGLAPATLALLFMASYFAGVVQSPITTMVILVEMTGAVSLSLPLGLTAILAYEVSRRICKTALYERLAEQFMASGRQGNA